MQPARAEGSEATTDVLGLPDDRHSRWDEFSLRYRELHEPLHSEFSAFCEERGAPPLPEVEFIHESPYLNLTLYPAEADYERAQPLGSTWHRLDSCVRAVDEEFEPPPGEGALVYVSLGSLGSADVDLMNRLVAVLAETPHRYVVSKGPQHELIELAPNMTGAEFLPQPAVLPQVDLVITHGGNNTVTESIHFGKPMIVLPLFWDQYDNAQRVEEVGFGLRLATYEFEAGELHDAMDRVLATDNPRLREASARLQASPGTVAAADLIERAARAEGGSGGAQRDARRRSGGQFGMIEPKSPLLLVVRTCREEQRAGRPGGGVVPEPERPEPVDLDGLAVLVA